jgi:Chaperone of endosialidase
MKTLNVTHSIHRSPLPIGFILFAVLLACFALPPTVRALLPPPAPDGGYPGSNTAEGDFALYSLTTGVANTAIGFNALPNNTTGSVNTAIGGFALGHNTTGGNNTANGNDALFSNTIGFDNTATGLHALFSNTTGNFNTATGSQALFVNTGVQNTATGAFALQSNLTANNNTADGFQALLNNQTGKENTAVGESAFKNSTVDSNTGVGFQVAFHNTTGTRNTAVGHHALSSNRTGSSNIALGASAGGNLTTGSNNIDIGSLGVGGESNTIRIGSAQVRTFIKGISGAVVSGAAVVVNAGGQLGMAASSERFKDEIKPMDKASEVILALKPVTFRYKKEIDPERLPQFGLVAEEVEKGNPNLVVRDKEGKPYSVRYEQVNAMLLNEFLKQHRKVEEQEAKITHLKSTVARQDATIAQQQNEFQSKLADQQKQIKALASGLQEVSNQLELRKPAPRLVVQ